MSHHPVFLALGSNIGDRENNLRTALCKLSGKKVFSPQVVSSLYETEAQYVTDQPDFLNMVLRGSTELEPLQLLTECKRVEQEMGRNFDEKRYGPRIIDIDILFYDAKMIKDKQLTVPHPGIAARRFVLEPLAEIAAEFVHPQLRLRIGDLLVRCQNGGKVVKIKSTHSWISN